MLTPALLGTGQQEMLAGPGRQATHEQGDSQEVPRRGLQNSKRKGLANKLPELIHPHLLFLAGGRLVA